MQTLSGVQRNLSHQKTLIRWLLPALLLLFYPSLEALYPLLPPFLGVVYIQWRDALYKRDYGAVAFWMLYVLIFESVWSLPLYGIWAVMILMFTVFEPKISHLLHSYWLLNVLSVTLFDLLYSASLFLYEAVMHQTLIDRDLILLYYFLADIAGVLLF